MSAPFCEARPIPAADVASFRRRAIFDCCKWDPQVEDVSTIAPFPLVLRGAEWSRIAGLAEALAREALAAEAELALATRIHARLGLPRPVRRALARAAALGPSAGTARLMRFDFHFAVEGWRISEANTDVPGGLNEASGFARLLAPSYPKARPAGDPAATYADALARSVPRGGLAALLHATSYSDDRQMMAYLARELEARGLRTVLASPAHVRWSRDGRAELHASSANGPVQEPIDLIVRFFPAEWLTNLPWACSAHAYFGGGRTPASAPATAILTQSKRFPLVWDDLGTALPTWRSLLPETRDPRDAGAGGDGATGEKGDGWVRKPALGRVGEGVWVPGATDEKERRAIVRDVRRHPDRWVAQRRFDAAALETAEGPVYPCVGVYTVDGRACGAYGRVARRPLIDGRAQDAAVLVEEAGDGEEGTARPEGALAPRAEAVGGMEK